MKWYRLTNTPKLVEYSADFEFFFRNQIMVIKSGITFTFSSRLESKVFRTKKLIFNIEQGITPKEIQDIVKEIHQEILDGKHGKGELVD